MLKKGDKRAQVTIFIIIGIVIIAGIVTFFVVRNFIGTSKLPASLSPVYTSFLACLEEETLTGIRVLESTGGYIELPAFEPGSLYMPFSSQLDFLGNPIPYWYYVSGNNIQKEQIPTEADMENSLAKFIEGKIRGCEYQDYYSQGYEIVQAVPTAKVSIRDSDIKVDLTMSLDITKGEDTATVKSHSLTVKSQLGSLYNDAKKVYGNEQKTRFLEEYGIDTLRLYAPVDGVELTCSPLTWNANEVFSELRNAIEANTLALKVKGGDYTLSKEDKYFLLDLPVSNVRFLNSKDWPNSFEVAPSEGVVLISKPVGNQPGL